MPPMIGLSQRLVNKNHHKVYYEGMPTRSGSASLLRRHGDEMERLPGGYYCAHGRSDDTMNLGGIKVTYLPVASCTIEIKVDKASMHGVVVY